GEQPAPPSTTPSTSLATSPFAEQGGPAVGGQFFAAAAYIDSAIPQTMYRFRFDSAYDNNRPDRPAFFYAKCGCFRTAGLDSKAFGPPLQETSVDYQEITNYLEVRATERLSTFLEVPVRFINPEQNANESGLGDINFGFKYAFIYNPNYV